MTGSKVEILSIWDDFWTPNDILLVTFGCAWRGQGDLGGRLGAQIDAKLEILTKNAHKMIQNHQNNLPKSSK